jgi:hypothetical protein
LNIHFKHASGIAVQNRSLVEAIRRFGAMAALSASAGNAFGRKTVD